MEPLKISIIITAILCLQASLSAQDKVNIKFGKVDPEDFTISSPLIDSSTNAVVVADVGRSEFISNVSDMTFSLMFSQKKRIKIINKNGFDAATITIPLYMSNEKKAESLEDLNAYTYNLEGGKVVKVKVEKSAIFTEQHSKNWIYRKFTFPALKEGSIIEYSYKVKSDFFFNFQPWNFQGPYPVLWSEYEADIPEFFKFVILAQGYQSFHANKVRKAMTSFSFIEHVDRTTGTSTHNSGMNSFRVEGSIDYRSWIMKDVPPLKEEAYTSTINNSIARLEFQLNQVAFPHSIAVNYMDNWEKVATDIMENPSFGQSLSRANNWLDDITNSIVKEAKSQKSKAQKIFGYIRENFSCKSSGDIYLTTTLKDVFKNKNGSVADINLLLIAMLKNQGIEATPVILSTRDHGLTHEMYPLMSRYNYVIGKVVVDGSVIYMDATIPQLAFGELPAKVYNGHAREITKQTALPVFFVADSLKEVANTKLFVVNIDNGGVEGSFQHTFGKNESLSLRNKILHSSVTEFNKALQQDYPESVEIENIQLDSLNLLNEPVGLKYDLKLKSFDSEDIVYFNPLLGDALTINPFAKSERIYPVEMPYTLDKTYSLTMEVPKGYKIDEMPKSSRVKLNENEGMYEYLVSFDGVFIHIRRKIILQKANFLKEDYHTLRDFYSHIVKKEAEQIVFKKL